jgi:dihydrofolate reductase
MRKLVVFNNVTLDGYVAGVNGDFSWLHSGYNDPEFHTFTAKNASGAGELLFGRVTYELMVGYWPTPEAMKNDPIVAEAMNRKRKTVFSRTLDKVSWSNARLVKSDLATEVRKMKQEPGESIVILGSASIVSKLATEGLIDEYQIALTPVVLGAGTTMFTDVKSRLNLKLTASRAFGNGRVFLSYEPIT